MPSCVTEATWCFSSVSALYITIVDNVSFKRARGCDSSLLAPMTFLSALCVPSLPCWPAKQMPAGVTPRCHAAQSPVSYIGPIERRKSALPRPLQSASVHVSCAPKAPLSALPADARRSA